MKKFNQILCITALIINALSLSAQMSVPANGGNKRASVMEVIGLTSVIINYDRPAVKGREGKIWGQLVHYGFQDLGYGTSKAAPWRAGANENTTIELSTDVKVEGKDLAAGKYGLFMAMAQGEATIIFSKRNTAWGSYFYKPEEDALRVTVKTMPLTEGVERLKYEFIDQTDNSATVALMWEKLKIPFKIETDLVKIQLASFRTELTGSKAEDWKAWEQAASYCSENNINLDEALMWSEYSIAGAFIGEKNFKTLSTKAAILAKMGKTKEADEAMKAALPMGQMNDLHQYARSLLRQKRSKEAFDVFKMNYDKNPTEFTTLMGMTRGYSAMGDYKKALEFAEKALPKAPDANNKTAVSDIIVKLKAGKDVN
jgi:Protein of unknown function (DUF2911)/Coatomer epsilon subunit